MAAFEPGLFAWATVMSRRAEDRAIVDAGLKALAFDSGPSLVCDEPAATYERASDAHGGLAVSGATNRLGLGDKIRLIPGHCDPPTPSLTIPRPWGRVREGALVFLSPRQPCRAGLADHRKGRGLLTGAAAS
jgi:hypothetical protein